MGLQYKQKVTPGMYFLKGACPCEWHHRTQRPLYVRVSVWMRVVACSRDLLHVVSVVMVVFAHPRQSRTWAVPTLAAVAVCHRDLERPREALATAQRALPPGS